MMIVWSWLPEITLELKTIVWCLYSYAYVNIKKTNGFQAPTHADT